MNCSFPVRSQLDLSLISHEKITDEARKFFFVDAEQALDPAVLPVDPSTFKLLDVEKFDRSRWLEGVFVVSEPNHEPRRGGFMLKRSDPMCPASDDGLLKISGSW